MNRKQKEQVMRFIAITTWMVVGLLFLATLSGQALFTGKVIAETSPEHTALYTRLGIQDLQLSSEATLNHFVQALYLVDTNLGSDITIALFDAGYLDFNMMLSQIINEQNFIQATTITQEQTDTQETQDVLKELEEAVEEIEQENPQLVQEVQESIKKKESGPSNKELGISKEEATRTFIPKPEAEATTPSYEPYEPTDQEEQKDLGEKQETFFTKILRFFGLK